MAGVPAGIALEIVLVHRLGFPEGAGRGDLGHHAAWPQAGGLDVGDGVDGGLPLLVAGEIDRRAVAGAAVIALAIEGRRVVDLEEEFQHLAIAGLRRVEDDLDRLGMGAVIAVGRVGHVAAGVADPRRQDARLAPDEVLHAPEAAAGENRPFRAHRISSTWSR